MVDYRPVFAGHGSDAAFLVLNAQYAQNGVAGPHYKGLSRRQALAVFTDRVRGDPVFQVEANDDLTVLEFVRLKAIEDIGAGRADTPWRLINAAFVKVCKLGKLMMMHWGV
jgi:hypothetical protein